MVELSPAGPGGVAEEAVQSSEKGKPLQGVQKGGTWCVFLVDHSGCCESMWEEKEMEAERRALGPPPFPLYHESQQKDCPQRLDRMILWKSW